SLAKSLNNKKYIEDAKKLFLIQIGKNIDKNGITIDYKQRNAVAYAVYDLEPLVHTALLLNPELYFKKIGNHGVSLSQGIAWLKPYLTGDKRNIEFENTKNKFDLERKKEGLKEFQGSFNPMLARKLIFLVSQIDENYKNLSLSLNGESGGVYNFFCEK
ncbi:alginate lyase family protein, partial [Rosenbergiella epipactidis]|uniref:alginate lyase family protein n=1 Tax=Rosenbergiella epipactidis TaxID=1544694 RepID=UPI001F4D9722